MDHSAAGALLCVSGQSTPANQGQPKEHTDPFSSTLHKTTAATEPSTIRSKRKAKQVAAKPTPTRIQPPRSTKKAKTQLRRKLIIDTDNEESSETPQI
ncbi:hypothetical protein V6N11_008403 [Hibiscus sabdariffa]|uniref:Uncharacterized protein n=2 Tax=Hibiscus sabdariffa TaxID=183260 RepID=A0ABR2DVM5_9ROSI